MVIVLGACTVMLTVDSAMSGRAPTWITVLPAATPSTDTTAMLAFAGIVTLAGTFATAGFSERTASVTAVGVGPHSTNITLSVEPRWMVWLCGPDILPITC